MPGKYSKNLCEVVAELDHLTGMYNAVIGFSDEGGPTTDPNRLAEAAEIQERIWALAPTLDALIDDN